MKLELLEFLCCPETHQSLSLAPQSLVDSVNLTISNGKARGMRGDAVSVPIASGLVRADGKALYPIRNEIPVMLISEAIALET